MVWSWVLWTSSVLGGDSICFRMVGGESFALVGSASSEFSLTKGETHRAASTSPSPKQTRMGVDPMTPGEPTVRRELRWTGRQAFRVCEPGGCRWEYRDVYEWRDR
jgi:hypothetical protein